MFAVATLAALALALRASAFTVSTPASLELWSEVTGCKPVTFSISGGNPSDTYTAYFVHGNDPCGDELLHIPNISGGEFTWTVNVTAGTSVMVALDNGVDEQWSGAVTVTGSDTSCLTIANTASSSRSSTGTTTRAGSTYTAPVNAASSAPSASDASTPNGASRAVFGITSALAVLGAAAVGLSL